MNRLTHPTSSEPVLRSKSVSDRRTECLRAVGMEAAVRQLPFAASRHLLPNLVFRCLSGICTIVGVLETRQWRSHHCG